MLERQTRGRVPAAPHTQLKAGDGRLLFGKAARGRQRNRLVRSWLYFVRPLFVVRDRVSAVETLAGDAMLVQELPVPGLELRVRRGRDGPRSGVRACQPPRLASASCSRSMLSNSARKLPAPKP